MSTNLVDIQAAISTKLNTITQLNGVYTYEPDKPTSGQYPFATITFAGGEGEFGDTIRNIRKHRFFVRIYQERTQAAMGGSKAEDIILIIMDAIYTAFDADTTLGGVTKFVKPISSEATYINREIGDTRVSEIMIEATTVVPSAM